MKILFLLTASLFTLPLYAQHTSGTISYEEKLTIDLKGQDIPESMRAFVPKEQKSVKVLYFNADQSLYENGKAGKDEGSEEFEQDGMKIRMERSRPDEKIFVDFKSREKLAQRDLMGRMFLVKETVSPEKWKFTNRQKNILGMPCQEAYRMDEKDSVTAWYTTAIPVSGGPKDFAGLPGMILEVNVGDNVSIKATRVDHTEDVAKKIKAPTKGKAVTEAEYNKLSEEKIKELQKEFGGKGNVIIKSTTIRN